MGRVFLNGPTIGVKLVVRIWRSTVLNEGFCVGENHGLARQEASLNVRAEGGTRASRWRVATFS